MVFYCILFNFLFQFEEMMDRLEKGSGQTVVTLQEAKSLLKEDDDLIIAVYDYWLNKRLKTVSCFLKMGFRTTMKIQMQKVVFVTACSMKTTKCNLTIADYFNCFSLRIQMCLRTIFMLEFSRAVYFVFLRLHYLHMKSEHHVGIW
jgi:hypothetical protein